VILRWKTVIRSDHRRSWLKAISWRAVATATTMSLVYALTGQLELMLGVGLLDLTLKLIFYFLHERAWDMIKFGRTIHTHERLLSLLTRLPDIEAP
jgi:adenylylsulfate kinase